MSVLIADELTKTFGEKSLLNKVSFTIEKTSRIGIIGANGTGKSTLLKTITKQEDLEHGSFTHAKNFRIQYVEQEPQFDEHLTVLETVFQGPSEVMTVLHDYDRALKQFENEPSSSTNENRLFQMQAEMDRLNAWEADTKAKTILSKLGIKETNQEIRKLSGGQKKRVALARALIDRADLLILDEPTNHLDSTSIAWLESFISQYSGALMMVTHDRYFLNRVTNTIFELDRGNLYQYDGNYETYLAEKARREEEALKAEDRRQNILRRELEWLHRGAKARTTKQKARIDRVHDLKEQKQEQSSDTLSFVSDQARLGKKVIEAFSVSKRFANEEWLFQHVDERVDRGERIGITGENGTGKTTFLNLLAKRIQPDEGAVEHGETVRIGYFTQGETEIDGDLRVLEYIREGASVIKTKDGTTITAEQMLERFLFPRSVQWSYVQRLSGGERRRLYLLRILMEEPNVLFLDEPTNNLDIPTLRLLEEYLVDFPGSVVTVSHDRYFLDRIADRLLIFQQGEPILRFVGYFETYWQTKEEKPAKVKVKNEPQPKQAKSRKKLSYKDQQDWNTIEERIDILEQKKAELEETMAHAGSDSGQLQDLMQEVRAIEDEVDQLMERWSYLAELMEES
ncbi:ABC-F family ATP-binding cassette domain-containing protein [Geomicrobium sediminis]|uniref:ATP-binding cassette subfamily F protein uup n=1 Tax=Geomicrobium sediminis TaxID=1347788 RepID=A0ABS2P922_9BACL|nr:ABC-F family ATP-binding cassette domain-containing protein [Geomicrobium sediminis]MBM7631636.1 ATP-binding cassette subfamily F protein uup [Geomicrobium sediminis]